MLPPLPRCSSWAYSSLISPSRISLPRKGSQVGLHIVLFEACSALTRVAACTLARSPHSVTRYPKASDISSPPCLLRLLPAGANRRVGLAPTGKRRLVTAHPLSGHCLASRRPPNHSSPTWDNLRMPLGPVVHPMFIGGATQLECALAHRSEPFLPRPLALLVPRGVSAVVGPTAQPYGRRKPGQNQ
jgi:hypothetical protein